jgi:hypothetical protein
MDVTTTGYIQPTQTSSVLHGPYKVCTCLSRINHVYSWKVPRPKKYKTVFLSGEVAKALGVTSTTLRAWEKQKKIPPATRDQNGYRVWSMEDMTAIRRTLRETSGETN